MSAAAPSPPTGARPSSAGRGRSTQHAVGASIIAGALSPSHILAAASIPASAASAASPPAPKPRRSFFAAAGSSAMAAASPSSPGSPTSASQQASQNPSPMRVVLLNAMQRVRAGITHQLQAAQSRAQSRAPSRGPSRAASRATSPEPSATAALALNISDDPRGSGGASGGHPGLPRKLSLALNSALAPAPLLTMPASSAALSINKLRKQNLELSTASSAAALAAATAASSGGGSPNLQPSAKKLWRSGMMKLWSLRNAFAPDQDEEDEGVGTQRREPREEDDDFPTSIAEPLLLNSSAATGVGLNSPSASRGGGGGERSGSRMRRSSSSAGVHGHGHSSKAGSGRESAAPPLSSNAQHWESMMHEAALLNTNHLARLEAAGRPEGSNMRAPIQLRPQFDIGPDGTPTGSADEDLASRWAHTGEVAAGSYTYLHLALSKSRLKSSIHQLRFQLTVPGSSSSSSRRRRSGGGGSGGAGEPSEDLELFICTTCRAPSRSKHSWRLPRGARTVVVSKSDVRFLLGQGHFFLGVYAGASGGSGGASAALGGAGSGGGAMQSYTLRVTASEDTFVPYSQLLGVSDRSGALDPLLAGTGAAGGHHRETTAKNRLANKLNTLKHNKRAFDSFQKRVQNIIETRMDAYAKHVAHQTAQLAALQKAAAQGELQGLPPAKVQINFIASNKAHTNISVHSPRPMKRLLYSSSIVHAAPGTGALGGKKLAAAAAAAASTVDADDGEDEPRDFDDEQEQDAFDLPVEEDEMILDEASALQQPQGQARMLQQSPSGSPPRTRTVSRNRSPDSRAAEADEAPDLIDDLSLHPQQQFNLDPTGQSLRDFAVSAGINPNVSATIAQQQIPQSSGQQAPLTSVHEDDREESVAGSSLDGPAPAAAPVLTHAASVPTQHRSSNSLHPATSRGLDSRRPSAIRTLSLDPTASISPGTHPSRAPSTAGLSPAPPHTGRRASRKQQDTSSGAGSATGFQQIPLTPVNLHLHDMLHAQQEMLPHFFSAGGGEDSASRHAMDSRPLRSSSAMAHRAQEKLRRLSKDHNARDAHPALLQHVSPQLPHSAQPPQQQQLFVDSDAISLDALSRPIDAAPMSAQAPMSALESVQELAVVPAPAPTTAALVAAAEKHVIAARITQMNVSLPPVTAPVPAPAAAAAVPPPLARAGSMHTGVLTTDSWSLPQAGSSAEDSTSVSGGPDSATASGRGSVAGSSAYHRHGTGGGRSRRKTHSRATSFFTEVSSGGGSSVDTHDALVRTVAAHSAEGGTLHAVGSARRWIRMPFTGPNVSSRRAAARKAMLAAKNDPANPAVSSARLFQPGEAGSTSATFAQQDKDAAAAAADAGAAGSNDGALGSQTARDSKQPVRGSLNPEAGARLARRASLISPEELAAKSALLRQTVENNLKLTQVALNKKPSNVESEGVVVHASSHALPSSASGVASSGDAHATTGSKPKLNLALSSMVASHGPMASNQYETTQQVQRQGYLRRTNPAKWTGPRSFAVRNVSKGAGGADTGGKGGASGADMQESPYLSSTSKTHRIKLELAYLHRTSKHGKKEKAAPPVATAVAQPPPPQPAAEVAAEPPVTVEVPVAHADPELALSVSTSSRAAQDDSAFKQSASSASSPIRGRVALSRTMSLPLHMLAVEDAVSAPISILPEPSPLPSTHISPKTGPVASGTMPSLPPLDIRTDSPAHAIKVGLTPVLEMRTVPNTPSSAGAELDSDEAADSSGMPSFPEATASTTIAGALPSVVEMESEVDGATGMNLRSDSPSSSQHSEISASARLASALTAAAGGASSSRSPLHSARSPRSQRPNSMSFIRDAGHVSIARYGGGSTGAGVAVTVAPFPSTSAGEATSGEAAAVDILKYLETDSFWAQHFFHSSPPTGAAPGAVSTAAASKLPLPADHLSLTCLCLDFASKHLSRLDKSIRQLESGLLARLLAQQSLILDNNASTLSLPLMPADHPFRERASVLGQALPQSVRWGPKETKDHASLQSTRALSKKLEAEVLELRKRFEQENQKIEALQKESVTAREQRRAKAEEDAKSKDADSADTKSTTSRGKKKKGTAISKLAQHRLNARLSSSSQSHTLLLPVNPKSILAQQLLSASAASLASLNSMSQANLHSNAASRPALAAASVAAAASAAEPPSAASARTPVLPPAATLAPAASVSSLGDDESIDSTAASHLNARTLSDWSSRGHEGSSIAASDSEQKDQAASQMTPAPPTFGRTMSRASVQMRSVTPSGRRSGVSSRASNAAPPTAAELLYGVSASSASSPNRRTPMMSPRTRRIIAQAGDDLVGAEEDDLVGAAASASLMAPSRSGPLRMSVEFKEDHYAQHQHHRLDGGGGGIVDSSYFDDAAIDARKAGRKGKKKGSKTASAAGLAGSAASSVTSFEPQPIPSLASSFVRLTRALSNASFDVPDASQASSASLGLDLSADGSASTSRLQRQTRLAKLKQSYAGIASEMRSEHSVALQAAQVHAGSTRAHRVVECQRGFSVAFTSQLTPVLNAHADGGDIMAAAATHGRGGLHAGSDGPVVLNGGLVGGYAGVTRSTYDASHLGHQSHLRLLDTTRREDAPHWQTIRDAGNPQLPYRESKTNPTSAAAAILAAATTDRLMSESEFKSARMVYAKLNYWK